MQEISFEHHRFPSEIIVHAVWLYARFTLSFRDVEDLLAERGLDVSYETVRRWFLKFGDGVARNLRVHRPAPSGPWYLDEKVIVVREKRHWLWQAVDNEETVLDFLVQSRRRRERKMQRFKSPGSAQRFLNVQAATYSHFDLQRHLINRSMFKKLRAGAFSGWTNAALNT